MAHRHGGLESRFRLSLVAGLDGFDDAFDIGAQPRPDAGVALAAFFRLAGAFARLRRIGQSSNPRCCVFQSAESGYSRMEKTLNCDTFGMNVNPCRASSR